MPGSSSFVTVTITSCVSMFEPSEARNLTEYTLLRPASAGDSKLGAALNASLPFEEVNSNLSPSLPPSGCQAMVAPSGSVARYVPTTSEPSSSMLGVASPLMVGGSLTGLTVTVMSMLPLRPALSSARTLMS